MKAKKILLIVVPVVLVIALLVMYLTGVFPGIDRQPEVSIRYTRPFILTDPGAPPPASLSDLLNTADPEIGYLVDDATLRQELLSAEKLTDAVDSRLSLSSLRKLRGDAEALIAEAEADAALCAANGAAASSEVLLAAGQSAADLTAIRDKIDGLLAPSAADITVLDPQIDMRGVWTADRAALLRWTPHGTWIPDQGYTLYRIIGDQTQQIASALATGSFRTASLDPKAEYAQMMTEMFDSAALTSEKMAVIGIGSAGEFAGLAYAGGTPNDRRERVGGLTDFSFLKKQFLTVPGTAAEKLPATDAVQSLTLQTGKIRTAESYAFSSAKILNLSAMSLLPFSVTRPLDVLAGQAGGAAKAAAVGEILEARQGILSKAFTDLAFAEDAGLSFRDDLSALDLPDGTAVTYRLDAADGLSASVGIVTGQETLAGKPEGLDGYGVDGTVSLRWQAPSDETDKSLIAGYHIERKKAGEKNFKRITSVPVAISYALDETGVFFEAPVFFEEHDLADNESAAYRIQSLDIFGRLSAYSDELGITVYKVTPPGTPSLDQPLLSGSTSGTMKRGDAFYGKITSLNRGADGVILPITKATDDTSSIVLYRAEAFGAGSFGTPSKIGQVAVEAADSKMRDRTVRVGKARMILSPSSESRVDLVYYDNDVRPGYSYKYWAAAADDWGNESAWSTARVIGVEAEEVPDVPLSLQAEMIRNELPDLSVKAPGFGATLARDPAQLQALDLSAASSAVRPGTGNAVSAAKSAGVTFGLAVSALSASDPDQVPGTLSVMFGNLPDPDAIHTIVAIGYDELRPDKSALVKWAAYSGNGLAGYHVYRAEVDGTDAAQLQAFSRSEVLAKYTWKLVKKMVTVNQLADVTLSPKEGRLYLYLVLLVPEQSFGSGMLDRLGLSGAFSSFLPGGWVKLTWQKPEDPQIGSYRIYRAETESFAEGQDPDKLSWNLVGERTGYTDYTEKVDQTYAHYYYYRVTSVDVWGNESAGTAFIPFRVPATSPPQTPSMLLPLAGKGTIRVNWAGVAHASKYIVYRSTLPKISEADLYDLQVNQSAIFNKIFGDTSSGDTFLSSRLKSIGSRSLTPAADTPVLSVDKFDTLQLTDPAQLTASIGQVSAVSKLNLFRKIADKYGPLALRPYGQLSEAAANLVLWSKIAEVTPESGQDPLGAFSYTDGDVVFGSTYYYTVQAVNDDDLASSRPLPVSSSPRKKEAFSPVAGLKGEVVSGVPSLSWNQAKDPNLTWTESREYVAGYIVYRSTAENGTYYQASPLISEPKWRDPSADPGAYNWYKVKVVDTAGYLSDFSSAVLVRSAPLFLIKIPLLQALPTIPVIPLYDTYQTLTLGSYKITNVKLLRSTTGARAGTGTMTFSHGETIEVKLDSVALGSVPGTEPLVESRILRGNITLSKAVYLPKSGVTFSRLSLKATDPTCRVDGYLQSPMPSGGTVAQNLMGDLYALTFTNSTITSDGAIFVNRVPGFRYGQLIIGPTSNGIITLSQNARLTALVTLSAGTAVYHLDLETLDNSGFAYSFDRLSFDPAGKLSGTLTLTKAQTLRLVIPAGLGIQATASTLTYADGAVSASASSLKGKAILPFRTFSDTYVPPAAPERKSPISSAGSPAGFDRFMPDGITDNTQSVSAIAASLTAPEAADLDAAILYLAERIQGTSLLVLPSSAQLLAKMSTVSFDLAQWSGHGMSVAEAVMTPANVGNAGADTASAIGVTPGKVALDLDRASAVTVAGAPEETSLDKTWVGIIVREGRLALPSAYIKQDNGSRIAFGLTAGELLYDLNGVSYQNLIYNHNGTPADFGEKLGSFRDVTIYDCMIDLYGNRVNIEMNGELGIPLFGYEKGKVKLYTNKDGDLVCTMSETPALDPAGTGQVKVTILGGSLMPDGLHVNGLLTADFQGAFHLTDVAFTELIIPSDMERLTAAGDPDRHYGQAVFDQPQSVMFHDFPMELRSIDFDTVKTTVALSALKPVYAAGFKRTLSLAGKTLTGQTVDFYQNSLTLYGGLQLSDNIALNVADDFDRIVIDRATTSPAVNYGASVARLDFEFEEFVKVAGVVKPEEPVASGESGGSGGSVVSADEDKGYVEYTAVDDTIDMAFNNICDLLGYSVHSKTRFGYDYKHDRPFFALGSYYDDPSGISFYYGKMLNINGVIGYNVDLPKEADGRFAIPKGKDALFASVGSMPVSPTDGGNYFFASTVILQFGISYQDLTIKVAEVRDCYIVVEKGPCLESGGDLYTPLDIEELITHGDFTYTGYTRIGYYHPQRLFQFDSVIEEMKTYSLTVSGEVGCEMNPVFWEIRIGYPDALEAKVPDLFKMGFGVMFRSSEVPDDSYIKAKMYFEFNAEAKISIVYVRAYLNAGAEGFYDIDAKKFILDAWLNGGVEGGIKVAGKRYNIISLMLSASGQLVGQSGNQWSLSASASIYYSLDLWLTEYEGSVSWHISESF